MAEPIFWATKERVRRRKVVFVDGKKADERLPQIGHDGKSEYDNPRTARGVRYFMALDNAGNHFALVMTNAAAHLDHTTPFGQERLAKARHFGWLLAKDCPISQIAAGSLAANQLMDQSIPKDTACERGTFSQDKPCKHYRAEQKMRQAEQLSLMKEKSSAYASEVDKLLSSQATQTKEITSALTEAVKEIANTMSPDKAKGKKTDG